MNERAVPQGTVTFLFTDIEASTRLLDALGQDYATLLMLHREIVRDVVESMGGSVVDSEGDANFAVFERAIDAVTAAAEVHRRSTGLDQGGADGVRVRIGIHTGDAVYSNGSYIGLAVHRARRICDAAHGGQTLVSEATRALLSDAISGVDRFTDLGRHRLKDLGRAQHLFQVTADGLMQDFPPLRTLASVPNNLPPQLTSFIGRSEQLRELGDLVGRSRLVTIVGAGGSGKTRLAMQVAAEILERFPDGVWFVDLSALSDGDQVPQAAKAALTSSRELSRHAAGFGGAANEKQEGLLEDLRSRTSLLILDNCEHLVEAAAAFTEQILMSCPDVSVLVTTRETLGVAGEVRWPIPAMQVPESSSERSPDALLEHESVRLFFERAAVNQPGFAVSSDNSAAVIEICRRLDGLPLGIELAAAWVHALSPDQILERLDDQFRLLSSTVRSRPSRQQTLRAAIDWSYDLLSPPEKRLLEALSIFPSNFSLEAAEEICSDEMIGRGEVLSLLASLINKSLVTREGEGAAARYRLLETIKQYGREILVRPDAGSATVSRLSIETSRVSNAVLQREGEYWRVGIDDMTSIIRDVKGLELIRKLVSSPNREWHVLDLVIELEGHSPASSGTRESGPPANESMDILDARARREFKERLQDLQSEIEAAEQIGDTERSSKLREEMDWIASALTRGTGLSGRPRRTPASVDRARVSTTKAIRTAVRKISAQHETLGAHLERSISTGTFCSYRPDPSSNIQWSLDKGESR